MGQFGDPLKAKKTDPGQRYDPTFREKTTTIPKKKVGRSAPSKSLGELFWTYLYHQDLIINYFWYEIHH